MPSLAQRPISLFRTIVLAGVTAFLITSAARPAAAQNSVPATAVQAARSPQFASRLAHPTGRPATSPKPALARRALHRGPGGGQGTDIYDNGPINGTVDAWTINFGFVVSDTLTVANQQTPITGMSFGAWLFPGDTLTSVQVSITSEPNGGTTYFNQTVNFTQTGCQSNEFGFNVCTETSSSFNGPTLNAGTYWVNLQNAIVPSGDPIYWDENSGDGCDSPGCPSQAEDSSVGSIPSESFTILGQNTCFSPTQEKPAAAAAKVVTVPPSPTQTYRVIYNFTGGLDGASPSTSLVIDAAGNLYGTTGGGGPAGDGTVFKLTPRSSGWTFTRLYAFTGANGAGPDSALLLTPDGVVGTTQYGGLGDGVLFGLSPASSVLPSVFSNWLETLLYNFTGGNDGANPGGSLALDSSGNLYGNAAMGGANHGGTLYEFTNGGIQVLNAFPSSYNDGVDPIGVINGSNGLYGITATGGVHRAGTLYTTVGGYQVLHSFAGGDPEGSPTSLTVDSMGNLYGASNYSFTECTAPGAPAPGPPTTFYGTSVFQVSPPSWDPSILYNSENLPYTPLTSWVSTDSSGNIYGATNNYGSQSLGEVFELACCWNYTALHDFAGSPHDGANPMSSPVVDAQGNIYGTTVYGGTYGQGVVWEISP